MLRCPGRFTCERQGSYVEEKTKESMGPICRLPLPIKSISSLLCRNVGWYSLTLSNISKETRYLEFLVEFPKPQNPM